ITHRLVNGGGPGFFGGQKFVERAVDGFGARDEKLVQVEGLGGGGHKISPKMPENKAGLKGIFGIALHFAAGILTGSFLPTNER
ncbi:MAG TPA: hypothetical protein VFF11_07105, partial [Candidatus Binatia bacterium]|nr:hypothetical protein [Candidatus Binatia bacterium]